MTLGDFIKSGGWDKVKFRDASGFANFDFKYTTRKLVKGYGELFEPACALNFPRRRAAILIVGNNDPRGRDGQRLPGNAEEYDRANSKQLRTSLVSGIHRLRWRGTPQGLTSGAPIS